MDLLNQLNEWIKTFASNPYVTVIGFAVGLTGFVYAIYIANRDHKFKDLSYRLVNLNIIKDSKSRFPLLDVTYNGKQLENFSITKISVANTGSEVIRPNDVAKSDPLSICIESSDGAELLDYGVLYASDKENLFSLEKIEPNKIKVNFDFVEPDNTAIFQILHTGKGSDEIKVTGTVIGAKKPFASNRYNIPEAPMMNLLQNSIQSPRALAITFSLILMAFFAALTYVSFISSNYIFSVLFFIPTILFLFSTLIALFRKSNRARDAMLRDSIRAMLSKVSGYRDDFI